MREAGTSPEGSPVTAHLTADGQVETVSRWPQMIRGFLTFVRIALGGVWLYAGLLKITDIDQTIISVRAFQILPHSLVKPMAYGLPAAEIALGLLLVVGLAVRFTAAISALFLLLYIGAIASVAARGLQIDCGCFSTSGQLDAHTSTQYTLDILRDAGLLLLSALLVWRPRTYWSVDGWLGLEPDGSAADNDEELEDDDDLAGQPDEPCQDGDTAHVPTARSREQ